MPGGDACLLRDQIHVPAWKLRLKLGVGLHSLGKVDGDRADRGVFHRKSAGCERSERPGRAASSPPPADHKANMQAYRRWPKWSIGKSRRLPTRGHAGRFAIINRLKSAKRLTSSG